MDRKIMPLGAIGANCVILWEDPAAAWIVDPGAESESINAFLEKKGLTPALVLLTHGHFDHIGALDGLLARHPGLPVHVGPGDVPMIGHPQNAWPRLIRSLRSCRGTAYRRRLRTRWQQTRSCNEVASAM